MVSELNVVQASRRQPMAIAYTLIAFATCLVGCGGNALPEKAAAQSSTLANPAERLGVRILRSGEDPEFPVENANLGPSGTYDEAVVRGEELAFKNVIELPRPQGRTGNQASRPLFLVWAEDALGSPIVGAFYTHRLQDIGNIQRGTPERKNVSFDRRNRRWFIPLEDLVAQAATDSPGDDVHLVAIDLHLATGSRVEVRLRLRVVAPLPEVKARILPDDPLLPRFQFIQAWEKSGWPVQKEEIANQGSRAVSLWIQAGNIEGHLQTILKRSFSCDPSSGAPVPPGRLFALRRSVAPAEAGRLLVERADGTTQALLIRPDRWARIELRGFEKIRLAWMSDPKGGLQTCPVPPPNPASESCEEKASWSYHGTVFIHHLWRKVMVGTAFRTSNPEVQIRGSELQLLEDGPVDRFITAGEIRDNPVRAEQVYNYFCHGTFRQE